MPHYAIDPMPVACEIGLALQAMVTRRVDAFDPVVLTCAKMTAGTASNVIPETVEMVGTLRAISERARGEVQRGHPPGRDQHRRRASVRGGCRDPVRLSGDGQRCRLCRFRARGRGRLVGAGNYIDLPRRSWEPKISPMYCSACRAA